MMTNFEQVAPLMIQKYERYLPTAFDDSLTMIEKVNKIIQYLNQATDNFNGVVEQWNEVMVWVMNDGLTQAVVNRLDQFVADGTLDQIINENIFNELNAELDGKANIYVSTTKPTTLTEQTFWYEVKTPPFF